MYDGIPLLMRKSCGCRVRVRHNAGYDICGERVATMPSVTDTLALGTVQLGEFYGIANLAGAPDVATAQSILETAWRMGVRYLDTAQAYGRSEEIIGRFVRDHPEAVSGGLRVITKLLPDSDPDNPAELGALLGESWKLLGSQPIWGVLLHREAMLDRWDGGFGETLRSWRDQGRIRHLGVSIRSEEGMRKAIASPDMEIIQAPASAFDRRMHRAGLFAQADAAGKKVFIRSVFLQGLVFLTAAEAARRIPPAVEMLECLDVFCAQRRIDRRRFAIGYARYRAPSATLVIGAETVKQIGENCQLAQDDVGAPELYAEWDATWTSDDPVLVDPSRWPIAECR